jgi:SNF2 family DNA or RNA helicase
MIYKAGLPYFTIPPNHDEIGRCYEARLNKKYGWILPAYPPLASYVFEDLEIIQYPGLNDLYEQYVKLIKNPIDKLDYVFVTDPLPHQLEAIKFALERTLAAIFLSCGLGKSKIVVDYLRLLRKQGVYEYDKGVKALIIAPKTVTHKWLDEIDKHGHDANFDVVLVDGVYKKRERILKDAIESGKGEIFIASNRILNSKLFPLLEALNLQQFIIDESHCLKTPNSKITGGAIKLGDKIPRKLILSGTPILGSPMHLYGQLRFLSPYITERNHFWYRKKFVITKKLKNGQNIPVGVKNLDILQKRVKLVAIEYSADQVLDLPPLQIIDLNYTLSNEQLQDYNTYVTNTISELSESFNINENAAFAIRILRLQQILSGFQRISLENPEICDNCSYLENCVIGGIKPYTNKCHVEKVKPVKLIKYKNNPKLETLMDLLESILVENHKVIVWAKFKQELSDITQALQKADINYVLVDGSVNAKKTHEYNMQFNDDPNCNVYVGQIACGIGIDLVAAKYAIYYGIDFDLGHYEQSIKRFHRIGQNKSVIAYRLIAKNTIEEYIVRVLDQKEKISTSVAKRLPCSVCQHKFTCLEQGVELFDDACVYKGSVNRQKAILTEIEEPSNENHSRSQGSKK